MLQPLDWPAGLLAYAAAFVFGYLCGSIPFGVLLTRLAGGPDVRAIGSGNIGATNVLRTGRKGLAAATLIGDMLKGTVAVLLARLCLGPRLCGRRSGRCFSRPLVSGLAALSRRQGGGDLYRRAARPRLAGGDRLLRDLARGRRADPLLLARGPRRQRRHAGVSVVAAVTRWTHNRFCCSRCCCGSCTAPTSCDFSAARKEKSEPVHGKSNSSPIATISDT